MRLSLLVAGDIGAIFDEILVRLRTSVCDHFLELTVQHNAQLLQDQVNYVLGDD